VKLMLFAFFKADSICGAVIAFPSEGAGYK